LPLSRVIHRQRPGVEVDLGPLQIAQLGDPKAMPEGEQDHGAIAVRPSIVSARRDDSR
jgi:hypothetical protein